MIHIACILVEYQTRAILYHSFEAIIRPYNNSAIFLKARFLQLSFKSISKASVNGFYDLEPMMKQSHDLSKIPFFQKNEFFNFFLKKRFTAFV